MKYLEQRESRVHGTFDFPFGYYDVTPGHPRYTMVDHWHPEYEIIRINKGTLQFKLNGRQYTGREGDFFIVQDGALHGGVPQQVPLRVRRVQPACRCGAVSRCACS